MSLFCKYKNKINNNNGNTQTKKASGKLYDALNINYRREQLERIRHLNEMTQNWCTQISNRFYDSTNAVCHFASENLASTLEVTAKSEQFRNPEFSAFLNGNTKYLDEIGLEQRKFYFTIQDKVIVPLREWRQGDYVFLNQEINKLDIYYTLLEKNKYTGQTVKDGVYRERIKQEHDKHLLQVVNMLATLDRIQHSHLSVIAHLVSILVEYGGDVTRILAPLEKKPEAKSEVKPPGGNPSPQGNPAAKPASQMNPVEKEQKAKTEEK